MRREPDHAPAVELDHVVIAVADVGTGAGELRTRYGLTSVEGGRHPGWGTANRIVPLGESYLELVTVVDRDEAAQSPFGRWVAAALSRPMTLLGWAVRTRQLEVVAERLGLTLHEGSRDRGGQLVRWRLAGIEQAAKEPFLPFFIEWGPGAALPGHAAAAHRGGSVSLATLELAGDPERLAAWLGTHRLPVVIRPGEPAVTRVILARAAAEFAVEPG